MRRECEDTIPEDHDPSPTPEKYEDYLKHFEGMREKLDEGLKSLGFMKNYMQLAMKNAQDVGKCALCDIEFHGHELDAFLVRVSGFLACTYWRAY